MLSSFARRWRSVARPLRGLRVLSSVVEAAAPAAEAEAAERPALPPVIAEHPMEETQHKHTFAVFEIAGKQFKVVEGDIVTTPRLNGVDIDSKLEITNVLLVGSRNFSAIGRPLVPNAVVRATVQEQTQAPKIIVFKKKRRKGYTKTMGHRTDLTVIRIDSVDYELATTS